MDMTKNNEDLDPDIYFDGENDIFRYHVNGKDASKEVERRKKARAKEKLQKERWDIMTNLIFDLAESWKKKELNNIEFQYKLREELDDYCEAADFMEFININKSERNAKSRTKVHPENKS